MAALSVQYSIFGMKVFQLYIALSLSISFLNNEFAETPPAIAIFEILYLLAALISFYFKISTNEY